MTFKAMGSQVPNGWINVDYAIGARLCKYPFFRAVNKKIKLFNLDWDEKIYLHDLNKKFPWPDSSIDIVYSSHTLEHFNKKNGRQFLLECHRILRQDGIIRIVIPDLKYNINEYLEGRIQADDFIENLGVLYGAKDSFFKDRLSPFFQFPHKCMYDSSRLVEILDEIGFEASPRDEFDSDISDIHVVELKDRTKHAVIVEAHKR